MAAHVRGIFLMTFSSAIVEVVNMYRFSIFPSALSGNTIIASLKTASDEWLVVVGVWAVFVLGSVLSYTMLFNKTKFRMFAVGFIISSAVLIAEVVYVATSQNTQWLVLFNVLPMSMINDYSRLSVGLPVITVMTGNLQKLLRNTSAVLIYRESRKREDVVSNAVMVASYVAGSALGGFWIKYADTTSWMLLLPACLLLLNAVLDLLEAA